MQAEKGYRVRLSRSVNSAEELFEGAMGRVEYLDNLGAVHVCWDDGRSTILIPGVDIFTVYQEKRALRSGKIDG